jgi:hypothetical protein
MKTARSKPGRAELIARWTARGLTLVIASVLLWFSMNSLIYHFDNYDRDYSSELDQFLLVACIAGLILACFFELAAGLGCLWLAVVWIYNSIYIIPSFELLTYLPLLIGALYVLAWVLGRRRVKAEPGGDPGGIKTGIEFIFKLLADGDQPTAGQEPGQDMPERLKKN